MSGGFPGSFGKKSTRQNGRLRQALARVKVTLPSRGSALSLHQVMGPRRSMAVPLTQTNFPPCTIIYRIPLRGRVEFETPSQIRHGSMQIQHDKMLTSNAT